MTDLLRLSGVHTHIGRYHILQGIDLAVAQGQTTMLLGRNGAGKTTPLRTIMGLWRASSGEISLAGERIESRATPDIARLGVGYVPESMAVFSDLTVKENLVLAARPGRSMTPSSTGFLASSRRCAASGCRAREVSRADR